MSGSSLTQEQRSQIEQSGTYSPKKKKPVGGSGGDPTQLGSGVGASSPTHQYPHYPTPTSSNRPFDAREALDEAKRGYTETVTQAERDLRHARNILKQPWQRYFGSVRERNEYMQQVQEYRESVEAYKQGYGNYERGITGWVGDRRAAAAEWYQNQQQPQSTMSHLMGGAQNLVAEAQRAEQNVQGYNIGVARRTSSILGAILPSPGANAAHSQAALSALNSPQATARPGSFTDTHRLQVVPRARGILSTVLGLPASPQASARPGSFTATHRVGQEALIQRSLLPLVLGKEYTNIKAHAPLKPGEKPISRILPLAASTALGAEIGLINLVTFPVRPVQWVKAGKGAYDLATSAKARQQLAQYMHDDPEGILGLVMGSWMGGVIAGGAMDLVMPLSPKVTTTTKMVFSPETVSFMDDHVIGGGA